jgi:hypothetical protein
MIRGRASVTDGDRDGNGTAGVEARIVDGWVIQDGALLGGEAAGVGGEVQATPGKFGQILDDYQGLNAQDFDLPPRPRTCPRACRSPD